MSSGLQEIDLEQVTKLCVGGNWFDIEAGTLTELGGVVSNFAGDHRPILGFRRDGEDAAIMADLVAGVAPAVQRERPERALASVHGRS